MAREGSRRSVSHPPTTSGTELLRGRACSWGSRDGREGSARESAREGRHGERIGISDVEVRMRSKHSVRKEVAKLGVRPSVHDALNNAMQVGAPVDVVRDAGGHDGQDIARALAALVKPCEEPIATTQD